ncbi:MAG: hypothetical protein AAB739_04435, partial [Patescibacteria group bacterium]
PQSRLGIVALADLSMTGNRKGGNVYICSRVTDIESNIVMDGTLFSYGKEDDCAEKDGNILIDDEGLPIFDSSTIASVLRHQLAIVGLVYANNTYGGSFLDPPMLGDGTVLGDNSEQNIAKARLYDLNFLRYASAEANTAEGKTDQLCWVGSVKLSQYLIPNKKIYKEAPFPYPLPIWEKICETNFPKDNVHELKPNGIANIIYNSPTEDLPIFGHPETKKK